ncbi:MAG TPA: DUF2207 domain-containing protein [Vicinamibacterales bacterium]|nr:DUF2207 domain-containing protein [Vicinamibacterales bacterium]
MSRAALVSLTIAVLVAAGSCDGGRPETAAERVDIGLNVLADGSVEVRETIVLRATPNGGARFERVIRKRHADALFDLAATIDGRPAPEGRGPGQIRVQNGRPTRVRFEFDPTPNPTRTLTLQYRVAGVVAVSGGRGRFEWEALAPQRRFDIADTRIELALPERTVQYGPAGVAEAGWTVNETARGITSERRNLPRDEAATLVATISTTTMALAEPRWQFNEAKSEEFMPAFLSGAIFILVIGAGVIWIVRFQHPRPQPGVDAPPGVELATSPVLQSAIAQRLRRGSADGPLAAIVDLGMRRRLEVREDAERQVAVLPGPDRDAVLAHEQILLDQLWLQQSRTMPVRGLRVSVMRNSRAFSRAVGDDLVSAGLADRNRIGVRNGLRAAGVAVLGLAVVCFVIVGVLLGDYGPWPIAMPGSILIVGAALLIYSAAFSILTPEGVRQSFGVRQRIREMRAGRADGSAPAARAFAAGLPLAIAAGFGPRWQKQHAPDLSDDGAFAWLAPAAGESRATLLARLIKPAR